MDWLNVGQNRVSFGYGLFSGKEPDSGLPVERRQEICGYNVNIMAPFALGGSLEVVNIAAPGNRDRYVIGMIIRVREQIRAAFGNIVRVSSAQRSIFHIRKLIVCAVSFITGSDNHSINTHPSGISTCLKHVPRAFNIRRKCF